jgi:hypothetical protein
MGDTRMHNSNQPHALTMTDGPILTFVLWRGAGMAGLPIDGSYIALVPNHDRCMAWLSPLQS